MENMSISYRQSQFELFPQTIPRQEKVSRPGYLFSSLTLSLENIIIGVIILMMAVIFSFSLGVEKGKKIATRNGNLNQDNVPAATELTGRERRPAPLKPLRLDPNQVTVEQASVKKPPPFELKAKTPDVKGVFVPLRVSRPADLRNTYTIQVASYKQERYAHKEAGDLKKTGHEIFVLPKGSYSIVCVGKFSSPAEAQNTLSRLRRKYKDCLVRRL